MRNEAKMWPLTWWNLHKIAIFGFTLPFSLYLEEEFFLKFYNIVDTYFVISFL